MLDYPVGFSTLDERRINLALQQAIATLKHAPGSDGDAAAVQAARQVLEVVAVTVLRLRDQQPIAALVAAADDLRDQVIAQIDRVRTTIQTPLDGFEQMVLADLEQDAWWGQVQTMRAELASSAAPPEPDRQADTRQPLTIKQAAKRLNRTSITIRRWAKDGKIRLTVHGLVPAAELDRLLALAPNRVLR